MKRFSSILALPLLLLISCSSSTGNEEENRPDPVPKGDRLLVVDLNEAEGESFDDVVARARSIGATGSNLSMGWEEIETAPGVYSPVIDFLAIAEAYFPAVDFSILLMIGPIDTNVERLPADLKGKALDDPEVIDRYKKLLDYVFAKIPTLKLTAFSIGNEVDAYLGSDLDAWAAYTTFYEATRDHVHSIRPTLPVGVKVRLEGLRGPFATEAARLNEKSDLILVTHYPIGDNFQVEEPSVLTDEFTRIVARYPNRPIIFAELGYPSSATNGSSEEKQAEFVREAFAAWDKVHENVTMISFGIMSDRSQEALDRYAEYYGLDDPGFTEFLRTLGLRSYADGGEDKAAWRALVEESEARGW